jgi:hypothetical protein
VVDEPDDKAKPVSMSKAPAGDAGPASAPARPRTVVGVVAAMGASSLAALIASASLFGQRDWLTTQQVKANSTAISKAVSSAVAKASGSPSDVASRASVSASNSATSKYPTTAAGVHHQVSQAQSGALISTVVLVIAMSLLAWTVYRGRHWSRWGVVAFWFLATFTQTVAGLFTLLAVGSSSVPLPFRVPAFFSSLFLIIAVILVNMRPSLAYAAASRPPTHAGAPARRGLFAPRVPPAGGRTAGPARQGEPRRARTALTSNAASRGAAYVEKQRAKKRATSNAESVARGAELARSRAKAASKSRRVENDRRD